MKSKTFKKILAGIFLHIIVYFLFGGEYNIYNLWKFRQKEKELHSEIQTSEEEKRQLMTEIEMLKNDSTYIEKIAREEFKMGKPDEKIYIVKSKDDKWANLKRLYIREGSDGGFEVISSPVCLSSSRSF